jgi:hypothetical protein
MVRKVHNKAFPMPVILFLLSASLLLSGLVILTLKCASRRTEAGYTPLDTEDAEASEERRNNLMENHIPCTITFRNISYTIETNKKVSSSNPQRGQSAVTPQDSSGKLKQLVLEGIQGMVRPGEGNLN